MSSCKIFLENWNGSYNPGSEIRGRIECNFDEETTLRGIYVTLKCKEFNEWGTGKNRHKGKNYILSVQQVLHGSGSSQVFPGGSYVYPFHYILPTDMPSSFSGPYGGITYKLKAKVDRPMRFDYKCELIFTVLAPVDINKMPKEVLDVSRYSTKKEIGCCCWKSGSITMDVELPKKAFVVAETINLKVNVCNMSNANVLGIRAYLKQILISKISADCYYFKKINKQTISLVTTEHGIGAHSEHTFKLQLCIPGNMIVPNFIRSKLFEIICTLHLCCEISGTVFDLDISVPDIQIGHIQWRGGGDEIDEASRNMNLQPMEHSPLYPQFKS